MICHVHADGAPMSSTLYSKLVLTSMLFLFSTSGDPNGSLMMSKSSSRYDTIISRDDTCETEQEKIGEGFDEKKG